METQVINLNKEDNSNANKGTGGLLKQDEIINGYKIVSKLNTDTAEAEIYICEKENVKYILKYYYSCEPNYELLDKIKKFDNPDIVSLYEYGDFNNHFYTVSEYAAGGALNDKDIDGKYKYLPLSEDDAIQVVKEVINAFKEFHSNGIIHRDIKPGNLFYKNEDGSDILVGDFGISSTFDVDEGMSKHLTQTTAGTEGYQAPEVYSGVIGPELDYYSLGVTLWELVTAEEPFLTDEGSVMYPGQIMLDTMQGKIVDRLISRAPNLSSRMVNLIKGLMTVRHDKRWNYDLVSRFLNGETVEVFESASELPQFTVGDVVCTSYKEIAEALLKNKEEAKNIIFRGVLNRYLVKINQDFANKLADKVDEYSANGDFDNGILYVVYALCPNLGFKMSETVSICSLADLKKQLDTNPDIVLPYLTNKDLGFYNYLSIVGLEKISDKIKKVVETESEVCMIIPRLQVAINGNEIKPFKDGINDNLNLKSIVQLYNLAPNLQDRFLMFINLGYREIWGWLENVTGRDIGIWRASLGNKNFLHNVEKYGAWNYFKLFLAHTYIAAYQKFEENGRYGLKDVLGNVVLEAVWQDVGEESIENKFIVKRDGLYGVVSPKGDVLLDFAYNSLTVFDPEANLYFAEDRKGRLSLISSDGGDLIVEFIGKDNIKVAGCRDNPIALFYNRDNLFVYKNKTPTRLQPADKAFAVGENINKVTLYAKDVTGFRRFNINTFKYANKTYKDVYFLYTDGEENYFAASEDGKSYGIINSNDELVVPYSFDSISYGSDDFVAISQNNLYGLYNLKTKNVYLKPQYESAIVGKDAGLFKADDKYEILFLKDGKIYKNGYIKHFAEDKLYSFFNDKDEKVLDCVYVYELNANKNFEDYLNVLTIDGFKTVNTKTLEIRDRDDAPDSEFEILKERQLESNLCINILKLKRNEEYEKLNKTVDYLYPKALHCRLYDLCRRLLNFVKPEHTEGLKDNFAVYAHRQGVIYRKLQEKEYALESFQLALAHDDTQIDYYKSAAAIACELEKYDIADDYIEAILKDEPKNDKYLNMKGDVLNYQEKYDVAITYYTLAIEANEKALYYENRAHAYDALSEDGAPNLKEKAKADRKKSRELKNKR